MTGNKSARNVVLTGFMGAGKTVVGKRLAATLGRKFLDLDETIVKETGVEIKDIFRTKGEAYFRELEAGAIVKLTKGEYGIGIVAATGGGAVIRPSNRKALRAWGAVICLRASVDEIIKRAGSGDERPLLDIAAQGKKREKGFLPPLIERLLKERDMAYKDCDFALDTTEMSVKDAVEKIKSFLGNSV
ncbi:MAG: shikimate kinase [Deltaproteobacteria bacterium]|nr:shikimate kinase [Deltaproteobacteria bacterium]